MVLACPPSNCGDAGVGGGASGPSEVCLCRTLTGEVVLSSSVSVPDPSESDASSSHESATAFVTGFFDGFVVPGAGDCEGDGLAEEVEILRLLREASSSAQAGVNRDAAIGEDAAYLRMGWRTTFWRLG